MSLSTLNTYLSNLSTFGEDGSSISADDLRRLNSAVIELTNELFELQSSSTEEEAELCMALLLGLTVTVYSSENKQGRVQKVLDRSATVLSQLDYSVLKCGLLLTCFLIIENRELLLEAKEVILSWGGRELTEEEVRLMELWNEVSNNRNIIIA